MRTTGIIRRIDDLGRIVIPKEVRNLCGINDNDPFEIYIDKEGGISLRKYNPNADEEEDSNPKPVCKVVRIYTNNETGEDISEDQAKTIISQWTEAEGKDGDVQADFFTELIEEGSDSDILWMIYSNDEAEVKSARKRYFESFHEYCVNIANKRFEDEYTAHTASVPLF